MKKKLISPKKEAFMKKNQLFLKKAFIKKKLSSPRKVAFIKSKRNLILLVRRRS